jgi:hypothetical protein
MSKSMLDRNFGEHSFKFRRWSAELAPDQSLEDTFEPEFWKTQSIHLAGHDKANPKGRGDIIEVRKPDTGLYAELLVLEVGNGYVRVQPLKAYQPEEVKEESESPLTTKWNFGKKVHEVVRKSDGIVMATGFQTKQSAVAWISNFSNKLKPAA